MQENTLNEAKLRAIQSLLTMKVYDTAGRDSVEVLRSIRRERYEYIASRHASRKGDWLFRWFRRQILPDSGPEFE